MGGPVDPKGIATAVALVMAETAAAGGGNDQQPELFLDADDAPSSLTPAKSGSKGGRPKGARNRSTEQWRNHILSRYQSPMIGLAETWSRSVDELAKELYLTRIVRRLAPGEEALETYYDSEGRVRDYLTWDRLAAFNLQQAARIGALPYLHQKQPIAIEPKGGDGAKLGILVLGDFAAPEAGESEGLPIVDAEAVDVTPSEGKP